MASWYASTGEEKIICRFRYRVSLVCRRQEYPGATMALIDYCHPPTMCSNYIEHGHTSRKIIPGDMLPSQSITLFTVPCKLLFSEEVRQRNCKVVQGMRSSSQE